MAQQTFFHETPHANRGLMFTNEDIEFGYAEDMADAIKAKAKDLDQSNSNIYRVIAQVASNGDGVQIFLAPYARYRELAAKMLESFRYTHKAYITDKNGEKRLIRKKSFVERLSQIAHHHSNNESLAISKTIDLIQEHFAKDINSLNKAIEKIAIDYNMGTVKHQCYYAGLAETWIEYDQVKKEAA